MMQRLLMKKWKSDLENENDRYMEWVELFSESFRNELDKILDEEVNFWEDFKNESYRDTIMQIIEKRLYDRA